MLDFTVLEQLKNQVKKIEASFNVGLRQSIDKNKAEVKRIQTDLQLFQGKNAEGTDIRPFYAPSTIRIKQRNGQPIDRVTLRDKGDFYSTIEVEPRETDFKISSQIEYAGFLTAKYANILGITPENMADFIERYTVPEIKQLINDIIAES